MAKRIPKTLAPDTISEVRKSSEFSAFAEVIVPRSPMTFTYAVPTGERICRGSVVWVHLGKRKQPVLGVVLRVFAEKPSFEKVKAAFAHASGYVFGEHFLEKLQWVSRYYLAPLPLSLGLFLPKDFGKFLDALLIENSKAPEVKALPPASPPLTEEQSLVFERLRNSFFSKVERGVFRGALLHGVTGSGKTRIYMELSKIALSAGKKVLVLVPEIGLAPQTAARFSEFLGMEVPVIHSAVSAPKKRAAWISILSGNARIVLGTRSAILSPFEYDLVILDEEHDASYKQQEDAPRYHARTLAFFESTLRGAFVLLGSATPSLESFFAAKRGKMEYVSLSKRATEMELPHVDIVDMRKKARRQDPSLLLSTELREALTKTVDAGDQAIVLLNRRGYSKFRMCAECGNAISCPECKVPLVYHKQHKGLLCHYCGRFFSLNTACPECGSAEYEFSGGAIEKLEEEIAEWIPQAKTVRMDRDSTANVGAAERILEDFRNGKYSVLLGTQIVAKGHDFPGVQLVGVVGADSGAGVPDFRSGERLFELLSQTAGRAGRSKLGGRVILQTNNPESPIICFAMAHDYSGFAEQELSARYEANYPPYSKVAKIELGHRDKMFLEKESQAFADALAKNRELEVLGPVDAYVSQVRGTFWMHLLLKAPSATAIRKALAQTPPRLEIRIDVAPV